MAIFKKEKKVKSVKTGETKQIEVSEKKKIDSKSYTKESSQISSNMNGSLESILKRPRITEKASVLSEQNMYVFELDKRANKSLVKMAVKELYKVVPIKVNIINSPSKTIVSRGIKGIKPGKKKAVIYLKKGDTIEII